MKQVRLKICILYSVNKLGSLFAAPSHARNLTATPGRTDAVIMWQPPAQPNGNVSYSFTIKITGTSAFVTSGVTTYHNVIITNLNAFTNYTVAVIASTLGGASNPVSNTFMTLQGSKFYMLQ